MQSNYQQLPSSKTILQLHFLLSNLNDTGHEVGALSFDLVFNVVGNMIFIMWGPILCIPCRNHVQDVTVCLALVFEIL